MPKKTLFLDTLNGKSADIPPIWIMRQAGRYLPEYREIRSRNENFMSFCFNKFDAMEVTLQPIRRFNFDASIIFSDILTIPYAMGVDLKFVPGKGPVLWGIGAGEIEKLKEIEHQKALQEKLGAVYEAIEDTAYALKTQFDETPLIGFAGCPFTLSCYMIEGGGSKDFAETKKFIYQNYSAYEDLIEILTKWVVEHLKNQIRAGAKVVKIFDSWAGVLNEAEFGEFCIKPAKAIVEEIKKDFPNVPIITFPKGAGVKYIEYVKQVQPTAIAVDFNSPLSLMEELKQYAVVQGNIDPSIVCYGTKELIKREVERLRPLFGSKYICNFGHGIIKDTPIENVEYFIKLVREG